MTDSRGVLSALNGYLLFLWTVCTIADLGWLLDEDPAGTIVTETNVEWQSNAPEVLNCLKGAKL